MRRLPLACLAALTFFASSAGAQQPAAAAKPQTPAPTTAAPSPTEVEVKDPLLTPMPAAAHQLANWRDVITQIKGRSSDVIIARAEIERSRGLWRQALARALPQINATGTATYDLAAGPATTTVAGTTQVVNPRLKSLNGSIVGTIPAFALQTWYDIGTADRSIKSSELAAEDKERTVLAATADAIVAVVTAERVAEVNRVNLRGSLQTLELTQRKQRLGSGTQLDVVRASQDVSTARATLITGDESLRKARESLGVALGYNDDWGVSSGISLDEIGGTFKQICAPAKADERTDVIAAKQNVLVAERGVTSAYLQFVPTVTLSTTLSASTQGAAGTLPATTTAQIDGSTRTWSISAILNVPIWDGGTRYGTIRIAKAQETENRATLDITLRNARVQTTQAIRAVEVSIASRDVAANTRDLAKEQARLSLVAFEAGTGTSFDLVTSQQLARQAELNFAVAEFQVIQAKIAAMLAAANCKF